MSWVDPCLDANRDVLKFDSLRAVVSVVQQAQGSKLLRLSRSFALPIIINHRSEIKNLSVRLVTHEAIYHTGTDGIAIDVDGSAHPIEEPIDGQNSSNTAQRNTGRR